MKRWICFLLMVLALPAQAAPIPPGNPSADGAGFEFAVYYPRAPKADPMQALRQELEKHPRLQLLTAPPAQRPTAPVVGVRLVKNVAGEYRAPDLESLQRFGHGISHEDAVALQSARLVMIVDFSHPKTWRLDMLKQADAIIHAVAVDTGGLVWDEETREIYSPAEWKQQRIDRWTGMYPDVADHTVIHAYNDDGGVRAITLGMAKFGLPDLVVENTAWSLNRQIGNMINLLGQSLLEGGEVGKDGAYRLEVRAIKTASVRETALKFLLGAPPALARLRLAAGTADEGDPDNALIEIGFDDYPGKDVSSRQDAMAQELFGSAPDEVSYIRHTDQLLAASERARKRLPELRRRFRTGLPPGSFIQLKAPFATVNGGKEWMWVEVMGWELDGRIRGLLKNAPEQVPSLHVGDVVHIKEAEVFDYLLRTQGGEDEGNETSAVIERMQH